MSRWSGRTVPPRPRPPSTPWRRRSRRRPARGRRQAGWRRALRAATCMRPVSVHWPVAGSYSSAASGLLREHPAVLQEGCRAAKTSVTRWARDRPRTRSDNARCEARGRRGRNARGCRRRRRRRTGDQGASRAGGTIGDKRTQPEPTAIAPPTSSAAMSVAAASSPTVLRPPMMLPDRGCAPPSPLRRPGRTATTRPVGVAAPSASRRRSTSCQTSGTGTRSRVAKRSRRSSIGVTQKLAETTSTSAEVGANGQVVRPEAGRDVADR